jgi:hypothetical protein
MTETTSSMTAPKRRRTVLRAAFTVVLLALTGWFALEWSRVRRQEKVGPELVRVGVYVLLEEPTTLGQLVRKFLPNQEPWLAERIGEGWFARQTVFICHELTDDRAPEVAERLRGLGTVREVQLRHPQLSAAGRATFERVLPGVATVPFDDPAKHTYYRSRTEHEQFAFGGAMLASLIAVALPSIALLGGWWAARRLVPRLRTA